MIDVFIDQGISAVSTLVAAFAGAWFAYALADKAHARQTQDQRVAAANEALFLLIRQYNVLKNVKDQIIDPKKTDPGRFINMRALPPLEHVGMSPNYEPLGFLLDSEDPQLLADLMVDSGPRRTSGAV